MARVVTPIDDKYPQETLDHSIDFTDVLSVGETVTSGSLEVHDRGGTDVTSSLLSGSVTNTTTSVDYTITGGTGGELYTLTALATLSTSEIIGHRMRMKVSPPG